MSSNKKQKKIDDKVEKIDLKIIKSEEELEMESETHECDDIFKYNGNIPILNEPHIDKDEENSDLYVCWREFGIKPSKLGIYSEFNSDLLWDILDGNFKIEDKSINKVSEIIPDNDGFSYNTKYMIRINENLYISFLEFDKIPSSEDPFCSNVTFYYNQTKFSVDDLNDLLSLFRPAIENNKVDENIEKNIFTIHISTNNQLELHHLNMELTDWDESNLDDIYTDNIIKNGRKLIKGINKSDKGLHIISGYRGCGKTTFLKLIMSKFKKRVIYIPITMIEHTLNNIDFFNFMEVNKDSVIIIDDCENYFNKMHQKSNIYVSNTLQLLDSMRSINAHILLSMNIKSESIDDNLFNCNNFSTIIEFDKLKSKKAEKLSKKMGFNKKYSDSISLSNIIKDKKSKKNSKYL